MKKGHGVIGCVVLVCVVVAVTLGVVLTRHHDTSLKDFTVLSAEVTEAGDDDNQFMVAFNFELNLVNNKVTPSSIGGANLKIYLDEDGTDLVAEMSCSSIKQTSYDNSEGSNATYSSSALVTIADSSLSETNPFVKLMRLMTTNTDYNLYVSGNITLTGKKHAIEVPMLGIGIQGSLGKIVLLDFNPSASIPYVYTNSIYFSILGTVSFPVSTVIFLDEDGHPFMKTSTDNNEGYFYLEFPYENDISNFMTNMSDSGTFDVSVQTDFGIKAIDRFVDSMDITSTYTISTAAMSYGDPEISYSRYISAKISDKGGENLQLTLLNSRPELSGKFYGFTVTSYETKNQVVAAITANGHKVRIKANSPASMSGEFAINMTASQAAQILQNWYNDEDSGYFSSSIAVTSSVSTVHLASASSRSFDLKDRTYGLADTRNARQSTGVTWISPVFTKDGDDYGFGFSGGLDVYGFYFFVDYNSVTLDVMLGDEVLGANFTGLFDDVSGLEIQGTAIDITRFLSCYLSEAVGENCDHIQYVYRSSDLGKIYPELDDALDGVAILKKTVISEWNGSIAEKTMDIDYAFTDYIVTFSKTMNLTLPVAFEFNVSSSVSGKLQVKISDSTKSTTVKINGDDSTLTMGASNVGSSVSTREVTIDIVSKKLITSRELESLSASLILTLKIGEKSMNVTLPIVF